MEFTATQLAAVAALTPDRVVSVYSGRPGCCCGCRGKHSYNSVYRALATKRRGYIVTNDEVNDAVVRRQLKQVQRLVADGNGEFCNMVDDGFVSASTGTRVYIAYLR